MQFDPDLLVLPLILFMALVLPLWIIFHYLTVWRRERRARGDQHRDEQELIGVARRLEERLDAIEDILDHDHPDWRTRR